MKNKFLQFFIFFIFFFLHSLVFAADKTITLQQGWNVFSTPNTLSNIEFSNSGTNLTFYTLDGGSFSQVVVNTGSLIPLNGYLVNNTSGNNVGVSLTYNSNLTPGEKFHQKTLSPGWSIVGITAIDNPLNTIGSDLTSKVTLTDGIIENKVHSSFSTNIQYKLGEAYAVFLPNGGIYGGYESDVSVIENVSGTGSATISLDSLTDITKVRGSSNVITFQLKVLAGSGSALTVDEVKVLFQSGATAVTSQQISQFSLYKGSVSSANLLDIVSGTQLADGVATFDGFNVSIATSSEQTFVVTASFVDSIDAIATYNTTLNSISVEDENSNVVDANLDGDSNIATTGVILIDYVSARNIIVVDSGLISLLELNASRAENENDKVILAGSSMKVVSYDIKADNEAVDVETVTFTYTGAFNLQAAGTTASLYLGDTLIQTNSNADLIASTITFNNLTSLIVPTTTSQLKLAINSAATGKDLTGLSGTGFTVTAIALTDAEGVDSGKVATNANVTATSMIFDIVPATVVAAVNNTFGTNDSTSRIAVVANVGNNVDINGNQLDVTVTAFNFKVNLLTATGTLVIRNGNGDIIGNSSVTGDGNFTVTVFDILGNNNEIYEIETTAEASFELVKNGIYYDIDTQAGLNTKAIYNLDLGAYTNAN